MNNVVYTKTFNPPPVRYREILRYSGVKETDIETKKLIDCCLDEVLHLISYKVCYTHLSVFVDNSTVDLGFTKTVSQDLAKNLYNCSSGVLFAATLGIEIDRLIFKYGKLSPSKALIIQAIGAERIESLCNEFNKDVSQNAKECGKFTAPRFSPGYGDLPLDIQKDFFSVLNPYKRIGLSLNESLLMSPSKSVSAIIGICDKQEKPNIKKCSLCKKTDCGFRR